MSFRAIRILEYWHREQFFGNKNSEKITAIEMERVSNERAGRKTANFRICHETVQ